MHIVFGMSCDGPAFPDFPGPGEGTVDAVVVGPSGLLDILETMLGLSGPRKGAVERIAAWKAKLEAAQRDAPRFWSASLAADGWGTARLLLGWRDSLVAAGWRPGAVAAPSERLRDLADAEAAGQTQPDGHADRLRAVIAAVSGGGAGRIALFETIEDLPLLPPGWRHLASVLAAKGVVVRTLEARPAAPAGSDLGRLQRHLAGADVGEAGLRGDGSLTILTASTSLAASEAVSGWLAAGDGSDLVLSEDGDSFLLDQALARHGRPSIGLSAPSPFRGGLQVLSLAFETAWTPFDPQKLVDLLLLPASPVSRRHAFTFATALASQPGLDGPAWIAAWDKAEALIRSDVERHPREADVARALAGLRGWVCGGRFDPGTGIPAPDARAICLRVQEWAGKLDSGKGDPLLLCVVSAARALASTFSEMGDERIPRIQIERMIDQAISEGVSDPAHVAEEGACRGIRSAGSLWAPVPSLVWWSFRAGSSPDAIFPWSLSEAAALEAAGCLPERPDEAARRLVASWQNAVLHVSGSLVLVSPAANGGAEAVSHPLSHRIAPFIGRSRPAVCIDADAVLTRSDLSVAGRCLQRSQAAAAHLPSATPLWTLPERTADLVSARTESATSLEDLVKCQFKWVLKHLARIRGPRDRSIPDAGRLFGNIAHAIAETAFERGAPVDPAAVRAHADAAIAEVISKIAAPLRLPGAASELATALTRIPAAIEQLAAYLSACGLVVDAVETEMEHAFDGGPSIASRIDLKVRHLESGARGCVDLKWTLSGNRRHEELIKGRAIQLSTYSRLIAPEGGAPAGYFLLADGAIAAEPGTFLSGRTVPRIRGLDATWPALVETWRALAAEASQLRGVPVGVEGALLPDMPSGLDIDRKTACAYCDFTTICRVGT